MEGTRRAWTPAEDRRIREAARAVQRAGRGRSPGFAELALELGRTVGGGSEASLETRGAAVSVERGRRVKGRNLSVLANIRRYDGRATRETAAPPKTCGGCGRRAEHWRLQRDGTLRAFCASCWRAS